MPGKKKPFYTYAEAQAVVRGLGIKTHVEYKERYRVDPKLPSNPNQTYANAGWIDTYHFFGKEKTTNYSTYAEAQAAAQRLGIKGQKEYGQRYREDPLLPGTPHSIYAGAGWTCWGDFLDTNLYPTYAEAKIAAQALGVKGKLEYIQRYREDPKLPATPGNVYANSGWSGIRDFLGTKKNNFYVTYAEARVAVQVLGIKSMPEYRKRYCEDPKLPSQPKDTYANVGWIDNYDFFGKKRRDPYSTYVEAKNAVQTLSIKTIWEYRQRYREDPRLPNSPHKFYANTGWINIYDFLGTNNPRVLLANYPLISADINRWVKSRVGIPTKKSAIKAFISGFYQVQGLVDDSKHLLMRSNPFNLEAYQQFLEAQAESLRKPFHSAIKAFYSWVLDEYCTDTDADERIVLPEYRNPFDMVMASFVDSLYTYRPNQSTKPPLGYEYILRGRNYLVPNGEQVLQSRPAFRGLPHLPQFFDGRNDWIYIEKEAIDHNDPNCIWRKVGKAYRSVEGRSQLADTYQIWSPVRFVALYTLLRYPLRGQQILWEDSGESDHEIAVLHPDGVRWEKNTGPLAGKGSKKRRLQAAVQRGDGDAPKLYVTTNKTGRGEGGYEVEWIPDDLVYWFLVLRDWQIKYNPLKEPTHWSDISLRVETNEKILKARGTQCFLFRTDSSGQPVFSTTAFTHTLPALLYKIQRPGENLASENPQRNKGAPRYISPYTPHSLRVSLITAFVADGDAPIHVISKLVGHASLVMTIYYAKLNNLQMRRAMGETEKRAAQIATERHVVAVRNHGLQTLRRQLIVTDGNRLLLESDVSSSSCVVFDFGICPMSAASCNIGGERFVERQVLQLYKPVEAGYLGQKNCVRCRFFVTGVPFLGGLVALANELALEIHTESARFQNYADEVDRLERAFYDACQTNQPDTEQTTRKQAIANQQQSASKLDGLLADYVAVNHYVQSCLKIINESENCGADKDGVRLIAASDLTEVGAVFEESESNYHLLAEICQNATIYRSSNPSRAVPLISQAIDRMVENNGLAPAMFRLNDEQKLVVANELNKLLLQRLGSWERIDSLFSGDLMLLDIDAHEPELTSISTKIKQLLSNPNRASQLAYEASIND